MHLNSRNYTQVARTVTDQGFNVRACAVLTQDQSLHLVVATWDGVSGQPHAVRLMWVSVNDGEGRIYDEESYGSLSVAMNMFARHINGNL
jgi:hypothetical protein